MPESSDRRPPPGGRVLLAQNTIRARVRELGSEITAHYAGQRPVFLGVMNGALFFLTDLLREVDLETEIFCVRLASYAGRKSTGEMRGLADINGSFAEQQVLIVDDILDSGLTLTKLTQHLRGLGAVDVRTCVLLQKLRNREIDVQADWVGFHIADEFVVGYGLDYDGRYRGLQDIWLMEPEAVRPYQA